MTREELNIAVGRVRAAKGLPPAENELRAWLIETRAAQGLPPEPSDSQLAAVAKIVVDAGLMIVAS